MKGSVAPLDYPNTALNTSVTPLGSLYTPLESPDKPLYAADIAIGYETRVGKVNPLVSAVKSSELWSAKKESGLHWLAFVIVPAAIT